MARSARHRISIDSYFLRKSCPPPSLLNSSPVRKSRPVVYFLLRKYIIISAECTFISLRKRPTTQVVSTEFRERERDAKGVLLWRCMHEFFFVKSSSLHQGLRSSAVRSWYTVITGRQALSTQCVSSAQLGYHGLHLIRAHVVL